MAGFEPLSPVTEKQTLPKERATLSHHIHTLCTTYGTRTRTLVIESHTSIIHLDRGGW